MELSDQFEDRIERAKRISGYQVFSDYLHSQEFRGFSWGSLTKHRKELREWIEKARNNPDLDQLHNFEKIIIVERINDFIDYADTYISERNEHDFVSSEWLGYYFYMPIKDPCLNPKIVTCKLRITSDTDCELEQFWHEDEDYPRPLLQNKVSTFKGHFSQNKEKKALSFNLEDENYHFLNIISSYATRDFNFQYGAYNRFDGTRIEAGQMLLTPISRNLLKRYGSEGIRKKADKKSESDYVKGYAHYVLANQFNNYICAYHGHKMSENNFNYSTTSCSFVDKEEPKVLCYSSGDSYRNRTINTGLYRTLFSYASEKLENYFFKRCFGRDAGKVVKSLNGLSKEDLQYHHSNIRSVFSELNERVRHFVCFALNDSEPTSVLFLLGRAFVSCKFITLFYEPNVFFPAMLEMLKEAEIHNRTTDLARIRIHKLEKPLSEEQDPVRKYQAIGDIVVKSIEDFEKEYRTFDDP